jgi:hypothetical protein
MENDAILITINDSQLNSNNPPTRTDWLVATVATSTSHPFGGTNSCKGLVLALASPGERIFLQKKYFFKKFFFSLVALSRNIINTLLN